MRGAAGTHTHHVQWGGGGRERGIISARGTPRRRRHCRGPGESWQGSHAPRADPARRLTVSVWVDLPSIGVYSRHFFSFLKWRKKFGHKNTLLLSASFLRSPKQRCSRPATPQRAPPGTRRCARVEPSRHTCTHTWRAPFSWKRLFSRGVNSSLQAFTLALTSVHQGQFSAG